MKKINTLLLTRWMIPVEPRSVVLENHALAIDQGKIIDILPNDSAKALYSASETLVLDHHVVMPGLVNAHVHSPMILLRGFGDDLPLMEWLKTVIWPVEHRYVSEAFVKEGALLAIGEMIRSGTTCINEHYFFPEAMASAALEAGIKTRVGIFFIQEKNTWAKNVDEAIEKGIAIIQQYKEHPLISVGLAPHASYTLSDADLEKIREMMETYRLPLHVHMHETKAEIEQDWIQYKKRPLKRFYDAGLLSHPCQLVHMTQTHEEDFEILKKTGASVVHCPSSNLKLASGICPVQALLNAGINVAVGTDGAASNNTLDLFQTIYLSALIGKLEKWDPTAISAMNALELGTINGARALGLSDQIGSLKVGKCADVIAVDMNRISAQPLYNPISQIVYSTNSSQVSDVWINGQQVLKQGQLTTLDEKELLEKAKRWQRKIINN